MREQCSFCGQYMVMPYGRQDAEVLLVGEFPGEEEMKVGVPFVGEAGHILEYELMKAGLDINQCRLTNLWLHPKNKEALCFEQSIKSLTLEMAGRKCLLMGSELAKYFMNNGIMDWSGLEVHSPLFPRSMKFAMMSPNPAQALHQPLGELRLAINKFVRRGKDGG